MRTFLLIFSLCLTTLGFGEETYILSPDGYFTYSVSEGLEKLFYGRWHPSSRTFHRFKIKKNDSGSFSNYGTVRKPDAWTRTYVFTSKNADPSVHHAYFNSWGSIFDCSKEFEITDAEGAYIGIIHGNWDTKKSAEFFFIDSQDDVFARATVDHSYSKLTIYTADDRVAFNCEKTFTATYTVNDVFPVYYWTVEKKDNISFDERFLWPFVSFIAEVWWAGFTKSPTMKSIL